MSRIRRKPTRYLVVNLPRYRLLGFGSLENKVPHPITKTFFQRLMMLLPWIAFVAVTMILSIGILWIGRTPHVVIARIDVPESMGRRGQFPSAMEVVIQQAVERAIQPIYPTSTSWEVFPPDWRSQVRSILSYGQPRSQEAFEKELSVLVPGQGITVMYALYKIASWLPYTEPQTFLQIHYAEAGDEKVDVWLVIDRSGSDRQVVADRAATSEVADPGSALNIRLANAIVELSAPKQYAFLTIVQTGNSRPENGRYERALAALERNFREFNNQELALAVSLLSGNAALRREPNSNRMHTYEMSLLLDRGLLANPGSRALLAAKSLHLLLHGDPDGATRYAKRLSSEVNEHGADKYGFYGTVAEALQFAVATRRYRWDDQKLTALLQSHFRAWDRWNIARDAIATTLFAACLADTACGKSETLRMWKLAEFLPRGDSLALTIAKFGRARAQGDRKVMRKASQEIDTRLTKTMQQLCDLDSSDGLWGTGSDACLVSLEPVRSAADMLLAESLLDDDEALSEVIETCRRLASVNLWSRRPRLCLADALARSGQYSEALQALDSSINSGQTEMPFLDGRSDETDAQIYLRIGELQARLGNFSAAEKSLLASVGGNSGTKYSRSEAQRRLALVQARVCRVEDACKTLSGRACDELLALSNSYFGDEFAVGWLALESRKLELAVSLSREQLSHDSQNVDGLKLLGFALLAKQDYDSAAVSFSRALSMASDDSELAQGIAVALSHKRDFLQALKYHRTAIRLSPFDFRQYAALVQTLSDHGYVAEAQEVARAAEPLRPASCLMIEGSRLRTSPRQSKAPRIGELHGSGGRKAMQLPDFLETRQRAEQATESKESDKRSLTNAVRVELSWTSVAFDNHVARTRCWDREQVTKGIGERPRFCGNSDRTRSNAEQIAAQDAVCPL